MWTRSLFQKGTIVGFLLAALMPIYGAQAADHNKIPHIGVVELFTSQGCSSCPPADVVLKSYTGRSDVIALSYSVDYWDYLGWKDTYGRPENSKRQRDYARTRRDGDVYTPQAVINGVAHVNGAHKALIDQELKRTYQSLDDQCVGLSVVKSQGDLHVEIDGPLKSQEEPLILWMLRVKDVGVVKVRRGENGGRKLAYHNVVLGAKKIANVEPSNNSFKIKQPKVKLSEGEHHVFLLQVGATGPILGASMLN